MRDAAFEIARQQAGFGETVLSGLIRRIVETLQRRRAVAAAFRRLHGLDDHMLADVGLTRADVEQMAVGIEPGALRAEHLRDRWRR